MSLYLGAFLWIVTCSIAKYSKLPRLEDGKEDNEKAWCFSDQKLPAFWSFSLFKTKKKNTSDASKAAEIDKGTSESASNKLLEPVLDNSTVGGWLSHAINSINRSSIKFSRSAIYRIIGKWKPLDFLLFRYYWRPAENFWLNSSNFPPHTEFCIWTKDVLTFPSLDFIQSCDDYVSGKKSAKKACRFEICTPLLTSSECLNRST